MSEEIKQPAVEADVAAPAVEVPTELDTLKAQIAGLKTELSAVLNNKNEILTEKKMQEQALREAQEAKLKKSGDFEKLLASSEASRKELETKLSNQMASISAQRVKAMALEAAQKVSDGGKIKFLAREIQDRLKDVEGEIRILDKAGSPTIISIDDLLNEMKASGDYDDLLSGSKSNGGGASGSDSSAGIGKMERSAFDKLDSVSKMEFMKKGGKLKD